MTMKETELLTTAEGKIVLAKKGQFAKTQIEVVTAGNNIWANRLARIGYKPELAKELADEEANKLNP